MGFNLMGGDITRQNTEANTTVSSATNINGLQGAAAVQMLDVALGAASKQSQVNQASFHDLLSATQTLRSQQTSPLGMDPAILLWFAGAIVAMFLISRVLHK